MLATVTVVGHRVDVDARATRRAHRSFQKTLHASASSTSPRPNGSSRRRRTASAPDACQTLPLANFGTATFRRQRRGRPRATSARSPTPTGGDQDPAHTGRQAIRRLWLGPAGGAPVGPERGRVVLQGHLLDPLGPRQRRRRAGHLRARRPAVPRPRLSLDPLSSLQYARARVGAGPHRPAAPSRRQRSSSAGCGRPPTDGRRDRRTRPSSRPRTSRRPRAESRRPRLGPDRSSRPPRWRSDVVGECHAAPAARIADTAVVRELRAIPQRDDHAARLEEHDSSPAAAFERHPSAS